MIRTKCLGLTDESRIPIHDFMHKVKGFTFKELTEDKIKEVFSDRKLGTIDTADNYIEIDIDDYIITLYNRKYYDYINGESLGDSVYVLNDEVAISKYVVVWVSECNKGYDFECGGEIKTSANKFYLSITIDII